MGDILTKRAISHDEAREAMQRLVNSHFNNPRDTHEHGRMSIPANPDRDDDLVLSAYIKQRRDDTAALERQQWINRKLFAALKDMAEFWRYGMAKPDGAQPTAEDEARVEKLAKDAVDALVAASPDYLSTLPPLEKRPG